MTHPERKTGRRLLNYRDLKARGIPWTRVHLARLEAAGKFPLHINVGESSIAWFDDEVDDFLEAKAAERDAKAAERAAKADSSITDSDCGRPLPGEVQGVSATASAPTDRRLKHARHPRAKRRAAAETPP